MTKTGESKYESYAAKVRRVHSQAYSASIVSKAPNKGRIGRIESINMTIDQANGIFK